MKSRRSTSTIACAVKLACCEVVLHSLMKLEPRCNVVAYYCPTHCTIQSQAVQQLCAMDNSTYKVPSSVCMDKSTLRVMSCPLPFGLIQLTQLGSCIAQYRLHRHTLQSHGPCSRSSTWNALFGTSSVLDRSSCITSLSASWSCLLLPVASINGCEHAMAPLNH